MDTNVNERMALIIAMEFGFKAREKGMNLQEATTEFKKLMQP